jgi:hypothetical protein
MMLIHDERPTLISHKRFYFHDYEGGQEEALFWAKDWRNWEYEKLKSSGLITAKGDWSDGFKSCLRHHKLQIKTGPCEHHRPRFRWPDVGQVGKLR